MAVSTQYKIQMMYYRNIYWNPYVTLLTIATPINLIKENNFFKKEGRLCQKKNKNNI